MSALTSQQIGALQSDIQQALSAIAEKHGLAQLSVEKSGSHYSSTMRFTVLAQKELSEKERFYQRQYQRYQAELGLPPLYSVFEYKHAELRIIGLSFSGEKVYAEEVATGLEYMLAPEVVIARCAAAK